jgi:hypothetical protein
MEVEYYRLERLNNLNLYYKSARLVIEYKLSP